MKRRDPAFVVVASLTTVGVYMLYWLYVTQSELADEGHTTPSVKALLYPLLALLALIVVVAPIDLTVHSSIARHIVDLDLFPALVIACCLSEVAIGIWWVWRFCGAVAKYTKYHFAQASAFWLFVLLAIIGVGWVWPGVVQGYLNTRSTEHH
jgi:hypothetical protein